MITIYPKFDAYYYSYYLYGLTKKYKNIEFSKLGFRKFHHHCLAFILHEEKKDYKIYISAGDGPGFNQAGLEWSDIYAKVNIKKDTIPKEYFEKVIPIGPSFAVKIYGLNNSIKIGLRNLIKDLHTTNYRQHLSNYYRQYRYRSPIKSYEPQVEDINYIFYCATLWRKEEKTNYFRYNFMKAAKSLPNLHFEGGFAPGKEDINQYNDYPILERKYDHEMYLEKTKKSLVAFNTPAVQGCLGWKLGEFLALGKTIISTPIDNILPSPLIHGKHLHIVDGSVASIRNSIDLIRSDKKYRKMLSTNARKYFLKYLEPKVVLQRILLNAKEHDI